MTAVALAPTTQATPTIAPLTARQEAFSRHYAAGGNGAAAARAAGYAPDNAKQAAHEALANPRVRARVEALREAYARTLRGEVAILLEHLDEALGLARRKGDHRAMLDIARLQAQLAALAGPGAAERRALLYDGRGGPGPLDRVRSGLDPNAAVDPDALAAAIAAEVAAVSAAEEAERAALMAAAGRRPEADPDLSRPAAGGASRAEGGDPDPSRPSAGPAAGAAPARPDLSRRPGGAGAGDPDFSRPLPAGAGAATSRAREVGPRDAGGARRGAGASIPAPM